MEDPGRNRHEVSRFRIRSVWSRISDHGPVPLTTHSKDFLGFDQPCMGPSGVGIQSRWDQGQESMHMNGSRLTYHLEPGPSNKQQKAQAIQDLGAGPSQGLRLRPTAFLVLRETEGFWFRSPEQGEFRKSLLYLLSPGYRGRRRRFWHDGRRGQYRHNQEEVSGRGFVIRDRKSVV